MDSSWQEVQLQDIVTVLGDGLHGTPEYDENGDYYFINGNNLENGNIVFRDKTKRVAHDQYLKHKKKLNDRTILVSINGTIGNVAYYNREKVILGKSACYFNLIDDVEKGFVRYVLSGSLFQNYLEQFATGTTIKNVSLKDMREFSFRLPPLHQQKTIARILGSLDDKIELNRKMNATLESMAQALFKSWFVDFDPVIDNALAAGYPIPEALHVRAETRKTLGDKCKPLPEAIQKHFPSRFVFTEEMGWIPEGWSPLPLSKAININPRVTLKKGVTAKFVDMKALPTSGYAINEVAEKEFSGGAKFENGDVLLARITPCLENGKTGVVDFLGVNEPGFGSTEFIVLRSRGEVSTPFIASLARDEVFRQHCITNMVGTSGRQRVHNSCFDSYYVCLPNESGILVEYHEMCSVNFKKITSLKKESSTLTKLRDTLLPKLLSGQLRIPNAEKLVEDAI